MSTDLDMHRAARLREYLEYLAPDDDGKEQRRRYRERSGYTKGRMSQQLKEGFGERAGLAIAERLGLRDKRWFERPLGTPVDAAPESRTLLAEDGAIATAVAWSRTTSNAPRIGRIAKRSGRLHADK